MQETLFEKINGLVDKPFIYWYDICLCVILEW